MIIFLNGSFGVGKTTVARVLRRRIKGSAIYNPELAGQLLRYVPRRKPLSGPETEDYQDFRAWRACTLLGIRITRLVRDTVIVPMAFTNPAYLAKLRSGAARFDPNVRHYCLTAPLAVIRERLSQRAEFSSPADQAWQFRRAAECCAVHDRPEFREQICTEHRSVDEVAADILGRIARS